MSAKMKRHGTCDSTANAFIPSQISSISASGIQQSGLSSFPGHSDTYPTAGDNRYMSSNSGAHLHRDRDVPKAPDHSFNEGRDGSRSLYSRQITESEKHHRADPSSQAHGQDMEIGCDDDSLPSSLEGLERRFYSDIVKLTKDQHDSEDAENTRHVEKLVEINKKYEEKLSALRARQAGLREEFLGKESHTRLQQHQQSIAQYTLVTSMGDARDYMGVSYAAAAADARRAYGQSQFESYRDQYIGLRRSPSSEGRPSYHGSGQAYSTGGRRC